MVNPAIKSGMHSILRAQLPEQLPSFLREQRWFGGKARSVESTDIADVFAVAGGRESLIIVVDVKFAGSHKETYVLPVVASSASMAAQDDNTAVLRISEGATGSAVILSDALKDPDFLEILLQAIVDQGTFKGERGEMHGRRSGAPTPVSPKPSGPLEPRLLKGEQSNSSIVYDDCLILKFFRRIQEGVNPDLEITAFLAERAHYSHVPALKGFLEYRSSSGTLSTQAVLHAFVPNEGDAWKYTLKSLQTFYQTADGFSRQGAARSRDEIQEFTQQSIGPYLESVKLLGRRTAELHLALASDPNDPAFAPEPFSTEFQKVFEADVLRLSSSVFRLLRERISVLPAPWQAKAQAVVEREVDITNRFRQSLGKTINASRIRIHGDYHLGQVLFTGCDFVIIDFEGEPARPLAERRIKRSPLQDVAGMLRSFRYAAFAPLLGTGEDRLDVARIEQMRVWAESWNAQVADTFLAEYFKFAQAASFLPRDRAETSKLLELLVLEKAIYELGYELNNRPHWVGLPLEGISRLLAI